MSHLICRLSLMDIYMIPEGIKQKLLKVRGDA